MPRKAKGRGRPKKRPLDDLETADPEEQTTHETDTAGTATDDGDVSDVSAPDKVNMNKAGDKEDDEEAADLTEVKAGRTGQTSLTADDMEVDAHVIDTEDSLTKDDTVMQADDSVVQADDLVAEANDSVVQADDSLVQLDEIVNKSKDRGTTIDDSASKSDETVKNSNDAVTKTDDSASKTDDSATESSSAKSKRRGKSLFKASDNSLSKASDNSLSKASDTFLSKASDNSLSKASDVFSSKTDDTVNSTTINAAKPLEEPSGFRFIDINLLVSFVSRFPCPACSKPNLGHSDPKEVRVDEKKVGAASVLVFTCGSCGVEQSMTNSARAGPSFEVNSRFHAAMFTIGNNNNKAKRFCSSMKMPEPTPLKPWMNRHT